MLGTVTASYAEVIANEEVAREHHVIALAAPEIAAAATPGQFAMLRVPTGYDPLLPRAFSFYRLDAAAGRVEFLYRVIGKGTRLLAEQRPGARLHIWGPLGRGFAPPEGYALLVGGGVGVPPLVCFAEQRVRERGPDAIAAYFGFATADFIVAEERLNALGVPLRLATDDGTRGHRGFVTDLLREQLSSLAAVLDTAQFRFSREALRSAQTVLACGPHPMLATVARLCEESGVGSQLALEAPMACGVGACIGCTVPRRAGGYARVCTEGPVFPAEAIAWE